MQGTPRADEDIKMYQAGVSCHLLASARETSFFIPIKLERYFTLKI